MHSQICSIRARLCGLSFCGEKERERDRYRDTEIQREIETQNKHKRFSGLYFGQHKDVLPRSRSGKIRSTFPHFLEVIGDGQL